MDSSTNHKFLAWAPISKCINTCFRFWMELLYFNANFHDNQHGSSQIACRLGSFSLNTQPILFCCGLSGAQAQTRAPLMFLDLLLFSMHCIMSLLSSCLASLPRTTVDTESHTLFCTPPPTHTCAIFVHIAASLWKYVLCITWMTRSCVCAGVSTCVCVLQ